MTYLAEEENLIRTALRKFEEQTGFAGNIIDLAPQANEQKPRRPDAWVEIQGGPTPKTFVAEAKKTIGRVWALEAVKHQLKDFNAPGLLVTRYLTPELARQCKNLGLQFLDTAGGDVWPALFQYRGWLSAKNPGVRPKAEGQSPWLHGGTLSPVG